jgi:hypothetical protein
MRTQIGSSAVASHGQSEFKGSRQRPLLPLSSPGSPGAIPRAREAPRSKPSGRKVVAANRSISFSVCAAEGQRADGMCPGDMPFVLWRSSAWRHADG